MKRRHAAATLLVLAAAVIAGGPLCVACAPVRKEGGPRPLGGERRSVERPAGQAVEGPLPRFVFLAQVVQRDELWDPAATTTYFLLDALRPGEGFRKVYEGPGEQYCRFLTPLLGGVGVAAGEVDPERKESERRLFWFDLLGGKPGKTIAAEPWWEWTAGAELRFRTRGAVHRLDPVGGVLRSYSIDLSLDVLTGESTILAVSPIAGRSHAVLVDVVKETIDDLGELPAPLQSMKELDRILPVGPAARDGLAFTSGDIDDFSLWYKPPGSPWLRVLEGIHIFKNFGGRAPWLPVAYLGDRRFAVGKTVADEAPRRKDEEKGPLSLSTTMLVDGMTGRVVEKTPPAAYMGNPDLDIPDAWWSKEAAGARKRSGGEAEAPGKLRRGREENTWLAAGDKVVRLGEKEQASLSEDGRWLAMHTKWAGPLARITFRIVDGATGEETRLEIPLSKREGYVDHSAWQLLTSSTPAPGDFEKFRPARRDPFRDPW